MKAERIEAGEITLNVRIAGEGPPLLLLHGFPETGACWDRVLPDFASEFRVIAPDLRGYGASDMPESEGGTAYTKRLMAEDMVALMAGLGYEQFSILGHDRGARVSYRLALDHPERVERIGIIEVVPTADMWAAFDADLALSAFHWTFLAERAPLPETLINAAPDAFLDHLLGGWTKGPGLASYAPDALAEYRAQMRDPDRVHAMCEDYRAGATLDRQYDEADRASGRKIAAPLHFLWSEGGFPAQTGRPEASWEGWAETVTTSHVDCGHFVPEERPAETVATFLPFFRGQ